MSTPYPSLNFGLGEEIDMLRDTVYRFAQAEIAPRAEKIDKDNQFPMDLWRKFGDLGLLGMTLGFAWQHWLIRDRDRNACLSAFLANHWAGMLVFMGIALNYWLD